MVVAWFVRRTGRRGPDPDDAAAAPPVTVADAVADVTPVRNLPYGDAAAVVVGEPVLHVPQRDYVGQYPPPAPSESARAAGSATPPRFGYDAVAPEEMRSPPPCA